MSRLAMKTDDAIRTRYPSLTVRYEVVIDRLRFDFWLPDANLLVEVQGEQHNGYVHHFHKTRQGFASAVERDRLKWDIANSVGCDLFEVRSDKDIGRLLDYIGSKLSWE